MPWLLIIRIQPFALFHTQYTSYWNIWFSDIQLLCSWEGSPHIPLKAASLTCEQSQITLGRLGLVSVTGALSCLVAFVGLWWAWLLGKGTYSSLQAGRQMRFLKASCCISPHQPWPPVAIVLCFSTKPPTSRLPKGTTWVCSPPHWRKAREGSRQTWSEIDLERITAFFVDCRNPSFTLLDDLPRTRF